MKSELTYMQFTNQLDDVDVELKNQRHELAVKAANQFGYRRLQTVLSPLPLLSALHEMGVIPFTQKSVDEYKESRKKVGMYSGTKGWLIVLSVVLPLVTASIISWVYFNPKVGVWMVLTALASVISVLGILIIITSASDMIGSGDRTVIDWKTQPLFAFDGDIPEHVLQRALDIKDTIPNATFSVDGLYEKLEPSPRPDPFLIVNFGNESYYVDVWDEKKYERTI